MHFLGGTKPVCLSEVALGCSLFTNGRFRCPFLSDKRASVSCHARHLRPKKERDVFPSLLAILKAIISVGPSCSHVYFGGFNCKKGCLFSVSADKQRKITPVPVFIKIRENTESVE
ncbi:unnamed protein product [Ixodes pacificus]